MSKMTVVSIVPFEVKKEPPGVYPGVYIIPAAEKGDFNILHINDAVYHRYIIDGGGVTLPEPGENIATSIVNDYTVSQIGHGEDAKPGLFALEGHQTKEVIKVKYKKELEEANRQQVNWFQNLVYIADDDWQKHKLLKMISDIQRAACKFLGWKRDWLYILPEEKKECPACGVEVKTTVAICYSCKAIINEEKYKLMKFAEKALA